ncbi:MAG: pantoate--beta-alanine ligase [Peptostreptococcaceae bacterium]|nr:pantoate--beta-alanine ligase [Peptostreptococcaceae bacterium]
MEITSTVEEVRRIVKEWRTEGLKVGFVPTMGFLHEGHESLIKRAVEENDRVVVSIFINSKQFDEKEDLLNYPKDSETDIVKCKMAGTHMLFNPGHDEMYAEGFSTYVDMETLTDSLCGQSRDTHFRGVCTVVAKLFNIVRPDKAYFGQKDAQQVAVVKRMVNDLNFDIKIIECETIREADGLAKSSRNVLLNDEERKAAPIIWEALQMAKQKILEGESNSFEIQKFIKTKLLTEKLISVDYVEIVESKSLKPVNEIKKGTLIAVAVYIGATRLIDNFTC